MEIKKKLLYVIFYYACDYFNLCYVKTTCFFLCIHSSSNACGMEHKPREHIRVAYRWLRNEKAEQTQ